MKRMIFFGGLVLALTAGAEARDWGFDKDTVYEWRTGGDTVRLVNNGLDTLVLDTILFQVVRPDLYAAQATMRFKNGIWYVEYYRDFQEWGWVTLGAGANVLPGQGAALHDFQIDYPWQVPTMFSITASGEGNVPIGDTIVGKLVFVSAEERDTLMLIGTIEPPSMSVRGTRRDMDRTKFSGRYVDALGRIWNKTIKIPLRMPHSE